MSLVFLRPDNRLQSSFVANNFMQNQYRQSNGFEPIKPRRGRRKRKLEETDIEDPIISDDEQKTDDHSSDFNLKFIKPSNKRRRTNQMNASNDNNNNSVIVQPELEANIYTNQLNELIKNENSNDNNTDVEDRSLSPYSHLIHPYLRNKNKNKNKKTPPESPLNLNGFKMKNKENESVNDWRLSIQSQLNKARTQSANIQSQELCERINATSGLGRDVLMAKLRKELPNHIFTKINQDLP